MSWQSFVGWYCSHAGESAPASVCAHLAVGLSEGGRIDKGVWTDKGDRIDEGRFSDKGVCIGKADLIDKGGRIDEGVCIGMGDRIDEGGRIDKGV